MVWFENYIKKKKNYKQETLETLIIITKNKGI